MDPIVSAATRLISQPVGIVRLSGDRLFPKFSPLIQPDILDPEHRKIYRIRVRDESGHIIDDGILLFFRAPESLTGEDVAELQIHGNPHSLRKVISHAIQLGARQARPGEFLYRAYLHQKISLLKAESLNRLIQAPSFEEYRIHYRDYAGEVESPLEMIRQKWMDLIARFYVILDHVDDEVGRYPDADELSVLIDSLLINIRHFRKTFLVSKKRWRGFSVLITGPVNSGKSSLFNKLLGDNRAIVSDIPGTTRDLLEGRISSEHGDIVLLDSAGIRKTGDQIEQMGIKRAVEESRTVSLLVWVNSPDSAEPPDLLLKSGARVPVVRVWNKCDLGKDATGTAQFEVSAKTRKGLGRLYRFLEERARDYYSEASLGYDDSESVLSSQSQYAFLGRLSRQLSKTKSSIGQASWEVLLHDLEQYNSEMELACGMVTHQMVYDRVFQNFCIGK